MEINLVKLIYFSPTGTTQKVLQGIAKGIAVQDVEDFNLTLPDGANRTIPSNTNELVILGAPVYGGRLPVKVVKRFKQIRANNTPAVLIVVYGNREFEDALLELKNLALELGFNPIAGGAFIGEHSFATKNIPIANGRPDDQDIQMAVEFGAQIRLKVAALASPASPVELELPGKFPYEAPGARPLAAAPVTNTEACTLCGVCASVCPTAAISIDGSVSIDIERCIRCCACIKLCPEDALSAEDSTWKGFATWLNENCSARKSPQFFGVDG
ncbi:MAG: 4Fe-4S binding protein [Pseudomonadota bacterium]